MMLNKLTLLYELCSCRKCSYMNNVYADIVVMRICSCSYNCNNARMGTSHASNGRMSPCDIFGIGES
jgi:hypothetical protein